MNITRCRNTATACRRGLATVWLIISLPMLLAALCLTVDLGNIWVERSSLENTVEAAVLAATRQWVDEGAGLESRSDIMGAIQEGIAYAKANVVDGKVVDLTERDGGQVRFEFGSIIRGQFHPNVKPYSRGNNPPAVRLSVTNYPLASACGMKWTYNVSVRAVAVADFDRNGRIRLFSPVEDL